MEPTDDIKVIYLQANFKACLIRCMLDLAKVKYTNQTIQYEDWEKMDKPADIYEYGCLPILIVNGKSYAQSFAIYCYLAKKLGFFGSNAEEEFQIMNILASWEDLMPHLVAPFFITDEKAKKLAMENIANNYLSWILPIYERKFTTKTGKYIVGDKLSVADMYFAYVVWVLNHHTRQEFFFHDSLQKYAPQLTKWAEGILNNECKDHFVNGTFFKEIPL